MKKSPVVSAFLLLLAGAALGHAAAQDELSLVNFDQPSPTYFPFSFKDEKGSLLNVSEAYRDETHGKYAGIRYDIVPGGWAGWGVGLKNLNAGAYKSLVFDVKGDLGGEAFDVGLRDTAGNEKRFPISQFVDVSREWQEVVVPLNLFAGLNLASLDNINLAFTPLYKKGRIFLDNIRFRGAAQSEAGDITTDPTLVKKALVDGFERTSPFDAYQVFQGDESTLNLTSSRVVQDGDYSMELVYKFSTERPWGSWVSAVRNFTDPLDWTGAQDARIWVKGDGSDNLFRFRFTESGGETWEYVEPNVLKSTRWTLVIMPFRDFELVSGTKTNGKLDADKVRSLHLDILSPTSATTAGAKTTEGRIQVDQLYVTGDRIRAVQAAPAGTVPHLRQAVAAIGNVDFSMVAFTEYTFTPEEKSRVDHLAKLITNAKLGDYSARAEIASASQEFGDASAYTGSTVAVNQNRSPNVEMPSFFVQANNISPYITNITLGNVFVDYSPYTFAPVFGFKGGSMEGDYDRFNYHAFVLKHSNNSFTAGSRLKAILPWWKTTASGVYWEQNGRLQNPSVISGSNLAAGPPAVIKLQKLADDLVYNVDSEMHFLQDGLTLQGLYGYNRYVQSAEANYTDPFNPVFISPLDKAFAPHGRMWRAKAETNSLLISGLHLTYAYRDVDTGYKPRYRQNPVFFDDTESDQWGHNVRVTQFVRGWVFSNEYDTLQRHTSRNFYRHRYNWGAGYYGYKGMDIAYNQEYRREVYVFTSDRSGFIANRNEKVIAHELYIRTQINSRMAFWIRPRQEFIWHPLDNTNFISDVLHLKLDYYVTTNARFFAEYQTIRFGNPGFEPFGFPFDDNFVRVSFEVDF